MPGRLRVRSANALHFNRVLTPMSASTLLHSLFKYKAWANEELFAALEKMDPATHEAERHTAIRILNHIYVVDRIFAAHLSGTAHTYTATNTPASVVLAAPVVRFLRVRGVPSWCPA